MSTVLALYPGTVTFRVEQMRRHAAILQELGVRVVLADDFVTAQDREVFDDAIELPPCDRVEEGWRALEPWLAQHRVDGVVAQSEPAILLGSLATKRLGLPGIDPEAALPCVSKHLCRVALARAGVPQPRFTLATDVAQARAFAREVGYPVVLKGTASALGRLVTLVLDDGALDAAVAGVLRELPSATDIVRLASFARAAGVDLGYDPARAFLVEAFAPGAPVETDGIVVGATPRSFGVVEQVLTRPPLFFMEGYLLPADRTEAEIAEIERVSDAALAALAVRDTGYSIEMRLHEGRASVIEVNGRLGWDEGFGDLFETVTGFQPALLALQLALGAQPIFARRTDVRCALAYQSTYADGIVERLPSRAELSELEREGARVGLAVHAGDRMHVPSHPDVSPHLAWALATLPSSSRAAYARARELVDRLRFEIGPAPAP
jgi:biotin carboxylase